MTNAPIAIQTAVPQAKPDATPSRVKLAARNLAFHYGDFTALKNINLEVPEKKVTALIGPSGCGKSTFLRTMNRMNDTISHAKVTGRIEMDGDILSGLGPEAIARRGLSMVPEGRRIFSGLSVLENLTDFFDGRQPRDRVA